MKKRKPIISDAKERETYIKEDKPAYFVIEKVPHKLSGWDDLYNADHKGKKAIQRYDKEVIKYSEENNIDPDVTRAIMFAENARGHKLGWNDMADIPRVSDSPTSMNINKKMWSSLSDSQPNDIYQRDVNIKNGTILLRRIADRVEDGDIEKIGTLWNDLAATKTNKFGYYINKVYLEKPWKEID